MHVKYFKEECFNQWKEWVDELWEARVAQGKARPAKQKTAQEGRSPPQLGSRRYSLQNSKDAQAHRQVCDHR